MTSHDNQNNNSTAIVSPTRTTAPSGSTNNTITNNIQENHVPRKIVKPATPTPTKKLKKGSRAKQQIDRRLFIVKDLVERQPTAELRQKLFDFSESTLVQLNKIKFKEQSLAKFNSNEDYIANSCKIAPTLHYPAGLEDDEATKEELAGWKDDVLDLKKKLTARVKKQLGRNINFLCQEHNKKILRTIISLGADISKKLKVSKDTESSTANADVIAMGALLNFVNELPRIENIRQKAK